MPPPRRKKTTKAERDRIQKRSADRKRQRVAKAKGEAVTTEEAVRRRRLQERMPVYRAPERKGDPAPPPAYLSAGRVLKDVFSLRRQRVRLLRLLRARLRQMSPT